MKFLHSLTHITRLLALPLLVGGWSGLPASLVAAEAPQIQQTFASPNDAVAALKAAVEAKNQAALRSLFGPELHDLLTGDPVQDANNAKRFAAAMARSCHQVREGEDKITLEVGPDDWPMPIPLVKADGKWHFDTDAGKEEIINRHVGKDELHAIGVCRAYVIAQRKYARENPNAASGPVYAQHLKSAPGKKDGLYWPSTGNEPTSPFGPLVAKAQAEGYAVHAQGTGPHAFHGYYFRILTRQGEAAPGGKLDYVSHGSMTGGFALVAYPVDWGQSGIMTFIVNQDGRVLQRDLEEETPQEAGSMKEYDPSSDWTVVQDEGVLRAASER